MVLELLNNIWLVFLDTAFWLLIGLLAAGFIKSFISENTMQRWVGGHGIASVLRAALFGAPLPLCSCGVLPAAIGLHRSGASKEATVSFLISTPETSVDSVAVTYALMGPLMAVFRPVAALVNAVGAGMLTTLVADNPLPGETAGDKGEAIVKSCCASSEKVNSETVIDSCCASKPEQAEASCCSAKNDVANNEQPGKLLRVISYAGAELLDDIAQWMAVGIVLAGIMMTFIPPHWLAQWGGGLSAMLVMLVIGVPMYICAVASTPVAAGLLLAGVSPGAVLIFLLVGPATNIASFALLKQELGLKVTLVYLLGLSVLSLMMGLLLEWLLQVQHWHIEASLGEAHGMLPGMVSWISAFVLIFLAIKPLRRAVIPQLG
ncbi:MAG: SO_0444 family Cu/Zn efflux transporter [Gammaproteobacteria bacterium]|nr:SO_0444 family Cu/Zn efflux transporter [Gammaproteobacteria bacterium]